MMRLLIPIILVGSGIGLFVVFTNPMYQEVKGLQLQNASLDDGLSKAKELRSVRDDLLNKSNAFSADDMNKLRHILPDNVDNIRLIIDINNIATRHNLALTNVDLGSLTPGAAPIASSGGNTTPTGSVIVGFSVSTANYSDFLAFLQDVEHSFRLTDVTKIAFSTNTSGIITYAISVQTYWLH